MKYVISKEKALKLQKETGWSLLKCVKYLLKEKQKKRK